MDFNKNMNFKGKVYSIVKKIPEGETLSYKNVAEKAGSPGAWRAVGNVLHKNYNSAIPCHRVIKSNGKTGGYNRGAAQKSSLLKKEGAIKK